MKQNNQPKLQQLLGDKQILEQVAKSPDAKALASLLTQGQDQASLKQIAANEDRSLAEFFPEYRRVVNTQDYKVDLSQRLWELKQSLLNASAK